MAAPHRACLVAVREAALHQFAAPPQQTLAVLAPHPPPVRVHGLLFGLFARPVPPPLLFLLRNVAAHFVRLHPLHHRAAVIALVGHRLFDPSHVHLGRFVGPQLCLAPNLLRHCHPGLAQRFIERGRFALIGALQRDRHHRTRVQIHRVLGLVRQMRASVLHLRNPRVPVRRALPLLIRRAFLALTVQPRQVFVPRRFDPRRLRQPAQKILVTLVPCPAAQSSASPHWLPGSSHRSRSAGLAAVRDRPARPAPRQTPRDASPDRSAAACAKSSSGPACTRPARCPQSAAAPANPPAAKQSRAPPRCPQNIRSAAPESKSPASATGARTSPHKTSRTGPGQTRRNPRPPAVHSNADRTDAPEPLPTPYVRSTNLLASPAACASPSPCADSTKQACGYLNTFCSRIQTCTTGC